MNNTLELDVMLRNMKYDQLMTDALRSGEYKRAINISRKRHYAIIKLLKKHGLTKNQTNSPQTSFVLDSNAVLDDKSE